MTWKVPVLGALVLGGSTLVVLAGSALVSSTRPAEDQAAQAVLADASVAKLDVRGMTCGSCATTARIAFERIEGVHDAEVSSETSSATVRYDVALTQPARFIPEFERMTGYEATVVDDDLARTGDVTDASTSAATSTTTTAPAAAGDER